MERPVTSHHPSRSPRCRELFEKLSEYLDGELDPRTCEDAEEHLEDCAPCRAFLESLRRTVALLDHLPAESVPEEIAREVREAVRRLRLESGR